MATNMRGIIQLLLTSQHRGRLMSQSSSQLLMRNKQSLATLSYQQHLFHARSRPLVGLQPYCALLQALIKCTLSDSSSSEGAGKKDGGFWSSLTGSRKFNNPKASPGDAKHDKNKRMARDASMRGKHQQRAVTDNKNRAQNSIQAQQTKLNGKRLSQEKRASPKSLSNRSTGRNQNANMELRSSNKNRPSQGKQTSSTSRSKSASTSSRKRSDGQLGVNVSSEIDDTQVKHDREGHKFILDLGDGRIARIDYKPINDCTKEIEMFHTEVPEELRGHGIGKVLARGALKQAREVNMKCKLTCSYLVDYLNRFADENERQFVSGCS